MTTQFDIRQSISHDVLDQLYWSANTPVDALLRAINKELIPPLRMKATGPASRVVNVAASEITSELTGRMRSIPHIGQNVVATLDATITLPATAGGNITFTTAGSTPVPLTITVNQYVYVLIYLDSDGKLGAVVSSSNAGPSSLVVPSPVGGTMSVGYFRVHATGSNIDNVSDIHIHQFVGSASGGGLPIKAMTAAEISGATLSSGTHYIIDMSAASGSISVTAPTGRVGANFKVFAVGNLSNGYNVTINANGTDKIYANGVATNSSLTIYNLDSYVEFAWDQKTLGTWVVEVPGGGSGAGASLLDPNYDETFIYYTRSDFSIDKKKFFGSTTGSDSVLGLGKIILNAGQQFISSNVLGSVFLADNPVVNTAQVRLLYNVGKVDTAPVISVSKDGGSNWVSATATYVSGLFVIADFTLPVGSTSTDMRVKVVAGTGSGFELAGFGINAVQDSTGAFAGDATFETRVITSTEASTGTITLTSVRFTPGAHQLHCNYNGHDFVAPDFIELGGGRVQFPLTFFNTGDTAKFYVAYGLVNLSNAPVTINNVLSSNDTLGSVVVPTGYTLDKPYMSVPAGATVSGAGNIETTGYVSGDGVLATSGEVLSTGLAPTQPKFDRIEEATAGKGVDFPNGAQIKGRTDGQAVAAGYVGEILTTTERPGAGGSAYSDYGSVELTNSYASVLSKTVNKGTYLVLASSGCYRLGSSAITEIQSYMALGGTAVTNAQKTATSQEATANNSIYCVVRVTSDSTAIALYSKLLAGTAAGSNHELTIVRIA